MNYKEVFQLAQDKGMRFLKCKHCGNIELNCLKDNLCTSCFTYAETPTTQWANGVDTNLLILTLIQKWLRDEHKIAVLPIDFIGSHYGYKIICPFAANKMREIVKCSFTSIWATYEQALLEGIHEALQLF